MRWIRCVATVVAVVGTGGCASWTVAQRGPDHPANQSAEEAVSAPPPNFLTQRLSPSEVSASMPSDRAARIYTCPMHPQVRQDHPGTCPICGMKLEPVAPTEQHDRSAPMEQQDHSQHGQGGDQ
ncbi:MAG: hypothetical protein AMXMBFR13_27900 [Phycisphaerae bacterium]